MLGPSLGWSKPGWSSVGGHCDCDLQLQTHLLIEKPENDIIVRAFLDQEDRSEFGERSPEHLFCARRCTYREQLAIRSAVGGSFHRSNSGRR